MPEYIAIYNILLIYHDGKSENKRLKTNYFSYLDAQAWYITVNTLRISANLYRLCPSQEYIILFVC